MIDQHGLGTGRHRAHHRQGHLAPRPHLRRACARGSAPTPPGSTARPTRRHRADRGARPRAPHRVRLAAPGQLHLRGHRADREKSRRRTGAALAAGLPATRGGRRRSPIRPAAPLRFDDQAEFQPYVFLTRLADALWPAAAGCIEHTRAHGPARRRAVRGGDRRARSPRDRVVVATTSRSSTARCCSPACTPSAPTASRRAIERRPAERDVHQRGVAHALDPLRTPWRASELLIVGGEGHKAGQGGDTRRALRRASRPSRGEHLERGGGRYRWSSQDNMPAPTACPLSARSRRARRASSTRPPASQVGPGHGRRLRGPCCATRSSAATTTWAVAVRPQPSEAAGVGSGPGDRERQRGVPLLRRPAVEPLRRTRARTWHPGEGEMVSATAAQVAGSEGRRRRGHAVSARCTHLGCRSTGTTPSARGTAPATARASIATAQ